MVGESHLLSRSARWQLKGRAGFLATREGRTCPLRPKTRLGVDQAVTDPTRRRAPRRIATRHSATQCNATFQWLAPRAGGSPVRPCPRVPRPSATILPAAAKWSRAGPASPYLPCCRSILARSVSPRGAAEGFGLFLFRGRRK
jgi:hypothetical protein